MKKIIAVTIISIIVLFFSFSFAQNSTDSSVNETIKIERADGTNIIITGSGDNTIHYNSAPSEATNATQIQAKFQVIIKERADGFVLIIPNAKYVSQEELSTEVDEVILELAKNQKWDLIWAE
jgi:hypothetical protein